MPSHQERRRRQQSPPTRPFNINHFVHVRLTDAGRNYCAMDCREPKEDADGWSRWQLWDLMSVMGEQIYMGCKPPFETDIRIEFEQ